MSLSLIHTHALKENHTSHVSLLLPSIFSHLFLSVLHLVCFCFISVSPRGLLHRWVPPLQHPSLIYCHRHRSKAASLPGAKKVISARQTPNDEMHPAISANTRIRSMNHLFVELLKCLETKHIAWLWNGYFKDCCISYYQAENYCMAWRVEMLQRGLNLACGSNLVFPVSRNEGQIKTICRHF